MVFLEILALVVRKKIRLIAIPLICAAVSFAVVTFFPKIYYTEVRLRVEDSSTSQPLQFGLSKSLTSLFGGKPKNDAEVIYKELLGGRDNLITAIQKFHLDSLYKKKISIDMTLKKFSKDLVIYSDENDIISCGFSGKDRKLSMSIVTHLVENANDKYEEMQKERMALTTKFLREKRQELIDSLELLNKELISFYKKNNVVNIESQIQLSMTALAGYEKELKLLKQQRDFARKSSGVNSPEEREIQERINILNSDIYRLRGNSRGEYKPSRSSLLINPDWALDNLFFERSMLVKIETMRDFLGFISKELALAEAEKSKEIPVIQILQSAYYPDWKVKPKRALYMVLVFMLSFSLLFCYELWKAATAGEFPVKSRENLTKFNSIISALKSWK